MAYNEGGIEALKPKPIGGRVREYMTLAQDEALLASLPIRRRSGDRTSDSTVYTLLKRHGWSKLMPRPFHANRYLAA